MSNNTGGFSDIIAGIFGAGCAGISCLGQIGITLLGLFFLIGLLRGCF